MADETRTVVIDVDVETKDFDKEIGDVNQELRKNRQEIRELSKDYESNSKEIAALESQNRKLSATKRNLIKESNTEANSLNALRLQLANQTRERNNLNTSTEEGARRFEELQESIAGLNEEISGFEQAGGDFRRNVGNYPQLLSEAAGGINVFGTSLSDVFKLIVANPIGLIITALTSLIAVFAKSQTGIEFFRTAGAALNIVLAKLADLVEAAGAAIIEAFESPQETLNDLVDNIRDGVLRYFTEFIPNAINNVIDGFGLLGTAVKQLFEGDFDGALETATEGTLQLVDGLTDLNPVTATMKAGFEAAIPAIQEFSKEVSIASGEAARLEEALIANEKAQADLDVERARSIARLKELNLIIEDTTKSEEERLAAAAQAEEIEIDLLNRRLELQRELVDIITEQNDLANSTEEDIQRRRDAEIEFFNIEAESLERSVTLQNKRNAIINQQIAKEEAQRKADANRLKKEQAEQAKQDEAERKRLQEEAQFKRNIQEQGLSDLSNFLGQETALGKAAAIADIASNSAKAVSSAIASGARLPFPANLGAIATGVTAVLSGISQARSLLGAGGGGISQPGQGAIGFQLGESLQTAENTANAGLSIPLGTGTLQAAQSTDTINNAIANLPTPQVAVTDINEAEANRVEVVDEATL